MNPYLILKVPLTAGDAEIRKAWQLAVQEHPPERDAMRFQQVQDSYLAIKDAHSRAAWAVRPRKAPADSPAGALRLHAVSQTRLAAPGGRIFRTFLQACIPPPDKP